MRFIRLIFLYLCVVIALSSCASQNQKVASNLSDLGGRSVESVRLVFEAVKHQSYVTYLKYLQNNPLFGGELSYRVTIQPNGVVSDVQLVTNTTESSKFAEQIFSQISELEFPDEDVNEAVIVYTYTYLPK